MDDARGMVLERIELAMRLGGLYHAEAAGLLRALYAADPVPEIYGDAARRDRYVMGFREGRTMLEVAAQASEAMRRTA